MWRTGKIWAFMRWFICSETVQFCLRFIHTHPPEPVQVTALTQWWDEWRSCSCGRSYRCIRNKLLWDLWLFVLWLSPLRAVSPDTLLSELDTCFQEGQDGVITSVQQSLHGWCNHHYTSVLGDDVTRIIQEQSLKTHRRKACRRVHDAHPGLSLALWKSFASSELDMFGLCPEAAKKRKWKVGTLNQL